MKTIYQSPTVTIRKAFFGQGVVVIDRTTGRKAKATEAMAARCLLYLNAQADLDFSKQRREFVENYIFERFAGSVLDPAGLGAQMFLDRDPTKFLGTIVLATDPDFAEFQEIVRPLATSPWERCERRELGDGAFIWIEKSGDRIWAAYAGMETPTQAEDQDTRKYWQVVGIMLDDPQYTGMTDSMMEELRKLAHKAILNHRREREFFRATSANLIAQRLGLHCMTKLNRQSGS